MPHFMIVFIPYINFIKPFLDNKICHILGVTSGKWMIMSCRNELKQRICLWGRKEDVNRRVTIMEVYSTISVNKILCRRHYMLILLFQYWDIVAN